MIKRYGTFMVRCWWLASGTARVEIEHIQSGDRARVDSLAAALAWLEERVAPPATRAPPDPPDDASGGAAPAAPPRTDPP